jgi:hypothetical protein
LLPLLGGMSVGLLLCRCKGGFGSWGSLESGADSVFPLRFLSSSASLVPRSSEHGACPRSMDFQRCLHLVHDDECLLRFFSKPCGDGAPSDLGLVQWVLMASGGGWWQRIPEASVRGGPRDLFVISLFLRASMQLRWNNCPLYPT